MNRIIACVLSGLSIGMLASAAAACPAGINVHGDQPVSPTSSAAGCHTQIKNGYPVPDPACTPGAINPSLTLNVLKDASFTTRCVRDKATSADTKDGTYDDYGVSHPANNTGQSQTCELDHLISLELGGADTLDNIWPQCGPDGKPLPKRYFKIKDTVENYLAKQVRDGAMPLEDAQKGIAADWTQYLDVAVQACPGGNCH